ncbi:MULTISPECIES: helix-turn-helix domain-containing protein [Pseudomonas syringae group]|uniref:helix-turn-helix domain-containing protein n=1 Tax=Pseudomonas syringae group TaxID=136849 RepID=UPI000EFEB02D|nr:helix-turn-helix domain-containing protein [Pseudomonas syringae group genomosp. 3]
MSKKRTRPSPPDNLKSTSINAKNQRLVDRLRQGSIDTFTAMRELNICRPGARICNLRSAGYRIDTTRIVLTDEWGRPHRGVALYTLMSEPRAAA